MAEVFNRFKDFLGFGSDNTAEEIDSYKEDPADDQTSFSSSDDDYSITTKARYSRVSAAASSDKNNTRENTAASERKTTQEKNADRSKVITMGVNSNLRVVLSKPTAFDNFEAVCSHLRGQMTVVLNLEFVTELSDRRRIFDFVSGCCYALDCSLQRVSDLVYVIAPSNVDVLTEVSEEEEEPISAF